MAYLLVTYFGEDGRIAARELLERRATRGEAQLEMFNIKLNWVDIFSWHNWGDRVGKYQLTMFGGCAFAPFARSIAPMLKEEGFHLVIGHQGLQRIAAADRVPVELHPALPQPHDVDLLRRVRRCGVQARAQGSTTGD